MAGDVSGTSVLTGDITNVRAVSGTLVGTSVITGEVALSVPLAGALAGTAANTPTCDLTSSAGTTTATPTISSVTPSPVTVGVDLTVSGSVGPSTQALAGTAAGTSAPTASLTFVHQLAGAPAGTSDVTGYLKKPITLPHTFVVGDAERTTGVADNDDVVLDSGEWIEYRVVVSTDGTFRFETTLTYEGAATLEVLVDNTVEATWSVP
jgi:hypothetical protein